jgi:hypothetical protein
MAHFRGDMNPPPVPSLIRWGAVLGGMVIGGSLMLVLVTLWLAIGYGADATVIQDNLTWFVMASAIVAMFVGGFLAGWLSGIPGAGPGFFNGLTVWGLILVVSLAIGIPGFFGTVGMELVDPIAPDQLTGQGDALWATLLSLVIGALTAGLGGALGGITTRPAFVYAGPEADVHLAERRAVTPVPPHEHRAGQTVDLSNDVERERAEGTTATRREKEEVVGGESEPTLARSRREPEAERREER